jgi:hypothetical protein
MRTITSMKMINCNGCFLRNKLVPYEWGAAPIPITDPLIANHNNLYYNFYVGGVAWFYYRLGRNVIYPFLDEDNYFNEDN